MTFPPRLMKSTPLLLSAALVLALAAGCSSPSTSAQRREEKAAKLASLSAEQQQKLQSGMVEIGFTADMVYVALGRPDRVAVTADGHTGIWTYERYLPSEAVSSRPFYAAVPGMSYRGRPVFRTGASAAGAHDGGAMGRYSSNYGYLAGGPAGTSWAYPDVIPVTLHVMFRQGHVFQFAVNDGDT